MNNSNRFLELSLKQQLALSEIGRDLIEIDTKIGESFFNDHCNDLATNSNKLPTIVKKICDFFKVSQKIE
jgi:hypothetical protein